LTVNSRTMESNAHDLAPAPVPTFANPTEIKHLDAEETEWNSRLLKSKANRQKIEENVNALRNRISFLENEEMKLISNIEATKTRALEVIKIKRDARVHTDAVQSHFQENEMHVEVRKEEVSTMKTDLQGGLREALERNKDLQLSKADEVKANLNTLKEFYRETKRTEQIGNMDKVAVQRTFESTLEEKKARILVKNFQLNIIERHYGCFQNKI
jgi:chromosome segregation ATPase